jgi:hypothetical protein
MKHEMWPTFDRALDLLAKSWETSLVYPDEIIESLKKALKLDYQRQDLGFTEAAFLDGMKGDRE